MQASTALGRPSQETPFALSPPPAWSSPNTSSTFIPLLLQTLSHFLAEWRNPSALPSVILAWIPKPYAPTFNSINTHSLLLPQNAACLPLFPRFCQRSPHPHPPCVHTQGKFEKCDSSPVRENSTLVNFNYSVSLRSKGSGKEWTLNSIVVRRHFLMV